MMKSILCPKQSRNMPRPISQRRRRLGDWAKHGGLIAPICSHVHRTILKMPTSLRDEHRLAHKCISGDSYWFGPKVFENNLNLASIITIHYSPKHRQSMAQCQTRLILQKALVAVQKSTSQSRINQSPLAGMNVNRIGGKQISTCI